MKANTTEQLRSIAINLSEVATSKVSTGYTGGVHTWGDDRAWAFFKTGADGYAAAWGSYDSEEDLLAAAMARANQLAEWAMNPTAKGTTY